MGIKFQDSSVYLKLLVSCCYVTRMAQIFAAFAAYNVTLKAKKSRKGFVLRRSFVVTQIPRMAQISA